jgi:vacuolar protein sorting-associated protein 26
MSFFGFAAAPVDVEIRLAEEDERRVVEIKGDKDRKEMSPVYLDGENVEGQVVVRVKDGKKFQHDGIRIELVGSIGE